MLIGKKRETSGRNIISVHPQINKQDIQKSPLNVLYSFEPEIISESEERERVTALAQRDFLIKSYGMLEQIYLAMKKNGMLRPADEQKYGLYGRLGLQTNMNMCLPSHRLQHRQSANTVEQQLQCYIKENEVTILRVMTILSARCAIRLTSRSGFFVYTTRLYKLISCLRRIHL
jgi:DNA-directed RNA polymerase beta' subunit